MAKTILAPGPTQCDPRFLKKLSDPVMYHRCSDFHKTYSETQNYLQEIIGQENGETLLLTCSGTGAMEASVSNFFSPGDEVLVISVGNFGNRFHEICEVYKLNVSKLEYKLGETYDYDEVKSYIEFHPNLKGVFLTYHETSSGVLNKLYPVGDLVADMDDCLFIVDAISGLMVHPMFMSEWGVDALLACSQKGFLLPPGIAIAALSDKALDHIERSNSPRYYNDFRKYLKYLEIDETPFTPNTSLIVALHDACEYLLNEVGMDSYYTHHENMHKYLYNELKKRNLDVDIVDPKNQGNFLVMFSVKPGWNAVDIHDRLDEQGFIIATGFGENKSKMLRIGVVGDLTIDDIDKFLGKFDEVTNEL